MSKTGVIFLRLQLRTSSRDIFMVAKPTDTQLERKIKKLEKADKSTSE
jgi:hypothetical protein